MKHAARMWFLCGVAVALYAAFLRDLSQQPPPVPRHIAADIRDLRELTRYGYEVHGDHNTLDWLREMHAAMDLNVYEMPPEQVVFVREVQQRLENSEYWRHACDDCETMNDAFWSALPASVLADLEDRYWNSDQVRQAVRQILDHQQLPTPTFEGP